MAVSYLYTGIPQFLAIAWVYRVHLNTDWLWTLVTLTRAKYSLKSYAICLAGARIRYDNLSAVYWGSRNVVENAGNGVDFIWIGIS